MSIDVVENVYMDLFERANHLEENGEETIVDIALKNEQLSECLSLKKVDSQMLKTDAIQLFKQTQSLL